MLCLMEMPAEDWDRHGNHLVHSPFLYLPKLPSHTGLPGPYIVSPGVFDFSCWLGISVLYVMFLGS